MAMDKKQRARTAPSAPSTAEPSRGLGGLESGMWVRLSAEVVERVKAEARAEDRKPSNMARVLIGEALAQREAKQAERGVAWAPTHDNNLLN